MDFSKLRGSTNWAVIASALLLGTSGCKTFTEKGMAAGSLLGAGTGAVVGSATGDAGAGALIGGALGAIGGGLVGAGLDETEARNKERIAAATAQPASTPISVAEIVQMAHSGVGDDVICSSIRSSNAIFQLTPTDVVNLHNQGVSDRVIQTMLDSPRRAAVPVQRVIYQQPAPIYVVEPGPPVISFGWHRHRCWW